MVNRRKFLTLCLAAGVALALPKPAFAQSQSNLHYHGRVTPDERRAAAARLKAIRQAAGMSPQAAAAVVPGGMPDYFGTTPNYANSPMPTLDALGNVVSGGIRKFMDALPGLGPSGTNLIGQYIPVAVADTTSFPAAGSTPAADYYEIGLVQYTKKMHTDLPPTTLRGYVQLSTSVVPGKQILLTYPNGSPIRDSNGVQIKAVDNPQYLGPLIIAQRDRPVRIKFTNYLPLETPDAQGRRPGDLFIPTDTSYMGAGMGPQGCVAKINITAGGIGYTSAPTVHFSGGGGSGATATATIQAGAVVAISVTNGGTGYTSAPAVTFSGGGGANAAATAVVEGAPGATYTQNRAVIHLHGGVTPWISDGTPHQWTTPVGENTTFKRGASWSYVPDMWFNPTTHALVPAGTPGAINDPGPGSVTMYYTNQQSARLMFYHDHAYGITRLNVYAGMAAGYLVQDPVEAILVNGGTLPGPNGTTVTVAAGTIPAGNIPLVIQDKTYVDAATIVAQDPTWNWGSLPGTATTPVTPVTGDLWFPHVYMPNQNPYDISGANACGRWDYGPWFWPPFTGIQNGPVANPLYPGTPGEPPVNPGVPVLSGAPEAFMDTPIVNGTAYPYLNVSPQAYRFRILNACNDRTLNLQLYVADPTLVNKPLIAIQVTNGGSGYLVTPLVTINGGGGASAAATAVIDPTTGSVASIFLTNVGTGYTSAPTVTIAAPTGTPAVQATAFAIPTGSGLNKEVKMVPAVPNAGLPPSWPTDGRDGGVPDPTTVGPAWIVIGSEGGLLPAPAVVPQVPVGYTYNRRDITVLNVSNKCLFMGPAERMDVIVDFSAFGGKSIILYNDAPAPVPAFDPRIDYYTADPDQSVTGNATGGAPTTRPGYGPNTRTIMQINVAAGTGTAFNLVPLTAALPAAFAASQAAPLVPSTAYNAAYGLTYPTDPYVRIQDNYLRVGSLGSIQVTNGGSGYTSAPVVTIGAPTGVPAVPATATATISGGKVTAITLTNGGNGYTALPTVTIAAPGGAGVTATAAALFRYLEPKAIQELFTVDYGRMNATLGIELPFTNMTTQTTIPLGYIDPPTEIIKASVPGAAPSTANDGTQLWKITHNGVDTHAIHFHLFNVQLVNRVGWDGMVKPPLPQELGWKETVIMNPLEDAIVALQPVAPTLPFVMPNSVRHFDVTQGIGATSAAFANVDVSNAGITVVNHDINFGWEYVWHCHILGHEENDMMRPIIFAVPPPAPSGLTTNLLSSPLRAVLTWNGTPGNTYGYTIQRATNAGFTQNLVTFNVGLATSYTDKTIVLNTTYYYRLFTVGSFGDLTVYPTPAVGNPNMVLSGVYASALISPPAAPTNLLVKQAAAGQPVVLTWTDNAPSIPNPPNFNDETAFTVQRANAAAGPWTTLTTTVPASPGTPPTTGTYSDTRFGVNRTYFYRVIATNALGASAPATSIGILVH